MKRIIRKIRSVFDSSFSGQTIIEVVVALAIASIVVTAVTVTLSQSLSTGSQTNNQTLATQYATEGIELVRQIRNNNYSYFSGLSGTYCLAKNTSQLTTTSDCATNPNIDSTFTRRVTLTPVTTCGTVTNITKVTVWVTWTSSKCTNVGNPFCHKVESVSCLTNYNVVPTP